MEPAYGCGLLIVKGFDGDKLVTNIDSSQR